MRENHEEINQYISDPTEYWNMSALRDLHVKESFSDLFEL